jgi:hypothetical protein
LGQLRWDLVIAVLAMLLAVASALIATRLSYRDGWNFNHLRSLVKTLLLLATGLGIGPLAAVIVFTRIRLPSQRNERLRLCRLALGGMLLVGTPVFHFFLWEAIIPAELRGSRDRFQHDIDLDALRQWCTALVPDETAAVPPDELYWLALSPSAVSARPQLSELPEGISRVLGTNVSGYVVQDSAKGRFVVIALSPLALMIGSPSFQQQTNPNFMVELTPGMYLFRHPRS